jgi:hypothetical protein
LDLINEFINMHVIGFEADDSLDFTLLQERNNICR